MPQVRPKSERRLNWSRGRWSFGKAGWGSVMLMTYRGLLPAVGVVVSRQTFSQLGSRTPLTGVLFSMYDTQDPPVVFGNVRFGHTTVRIFWKRPLDLLALTRREGSGGRRGDN
jgi:hypothetical protein